jgi:hypothetical protein
MRRLLRDNALSIALFALFLLSFVLHALGGHAEFNQQQLEHGAAQVSLWSFVTSSEFWFQSMQNWQSEFLAVAALTVLGIFLRQRGSPESKPVAAPTPRPAAADDARVLRSVTVEDVGGRPDPVARHVQACGQRLPPCWRRERLTPVVGHADRLPIVELGDRDVAVHPAVATLGATGARHPPPAGPRGCAQGGSGEHSRSAQSRLAWLFAPSC